MRQPRNDCCHENLMKTKTINYKNPLDFLLKMCIIVSCELQDAHWGIAKW